MGFKKKTWAAATALLVSASMLATPIAGIEAKAAATSNSTLIWSDEFNGSSLDTSKWTCEIGNGGWGNNEWEYYTDRAENVSVHDGALHLTARKENYGGSNYTSARIKTQGKFNFTYGHIESRFKIPAGQGIWPAFWMLGENIGQVGWPKCGEIDIMEAINAEYKVYGTCHWDSNGHAEYGNSSGSFDVTQFHTYVCDWDDQYIRMYVDGTKYHEISIANYAGNTEELHQRMFLLYNVAVCGNWPGFSCDDSKFPQEMVVDYVRVYQDNINYTSTSGNSVDKNQGTNNNTNTNTNNNNNNNNNNNSASTSTPSSGMGMNYSNGSSAQAFVNDSSWADIHFSVNGGGQQNVRMTQSGSKATYTVNGLKDGDTVSYWFTYAATNGYVQDTQRYTYTHKSGSTSSSTNTNTNTNNNTSVNTASGDVYIYQDINYGGRSASLGLGNYNLSSLQAKGFKNDDLTSLKVPFGYKVTLYEHDNFQGAAKVITSDTSWIGSDWNDKMSSMKVEKARYRIFNRHSGLCLDVANASHDSGANIQQWYENGNDAQVFEVTMNSDSSFVITSVMHGKALDMGGWSKDNGGNLIIWDNNNTDNQRWWITDLGDGYSSIINKNSNKGLDVAEWSTVGGGNVHQWDYLGQANQQWKFVLVN